MPLQKCPRCNKIFFRTTSAVCDGCTASEDEEHSRIRSVLESKPQLDAQGLAIAAEVSLECVLRMLRAGLIQGTDSDEAIKCGRCGAPALSASKRLCQSCLIKLDQECAETLRGIKRKPRLAGTKANDVRASVDRKRGVISDDDLEKLVTNQPGRAGKGMATRPGGRRRGRE